MTEPNYLSHKADFYGIDKLRSEDERALLACKLTLASILQSINKDVRLISIPNLNTLEIELRIIRNAMKIWIDTGKDTEFIAKNYVISLTAIRKDSSNAYNAISAAYMIRKLGDSNISATQWIEYFECFDICRDCISKAIPRFMIRY